MFVIINGPQVAGSVPVIDGAVAEVAGTMGPWLHDQLHLHDRLESKRRGVANWSQWSAPGQLQPRQGDEDFVWVPDAKKTLCEATFVAFYERFGTEPNRYVSCYNEVRCHREQLLALDRRRWDGPKLAAAQHVAESLAPLSRFLPNQV